MSSFFVRRPIVAMVISILMVLIGAVTMTGLPIAQYPDVTPPMIQVTTTFTGASAVDIEQSVATPIEQQVNGVQDMIYMKSVNASDGTFTLQVSFEVGSDLDMSNVLVQNKVSQATATLPSSVKAYGVNIKKSLTFPLMVVVLRSPNGTYDGAFMSNYATININDQLLRTGGVGDVKVMGSSDYAMRVWVRPDLLARFDLTVADLSRAIQAQNTIAPAGSIGGAPAPRGTEFTYTVRTRGRLPLAEDFEKIVVKSAPDGSQVRLGDVARVELGTSIYGMVGRNNGRPAAVLAIYQQPGSNALVVAESIRRVMADVATQFPPDFEYDVALDTTLAISEGINEIVHTLFEAVLLVILVVFVFLQNWRATLIPLLTVPVSLVATFAVFPLLGFSINTLSLLGLVLAIGIVVDDAIVVVEAVMHHIEQGMKPKDATLQAMREVSGPVVAIALVLSAVFIPVGFMGGITGRLYQQFAITIAISVCFSAFNALTLSPALAALLLRPKGEKRSLLDAFYRWFNRLFERFTGGYVSFTGILVRKAFRSAVLVLLFAGLAAWLGLRIPGGFVPEEDNGYLMASVQLPDGASAERTDEVCRKVEAIVGRIPAVYSSTMATGYNIISGAGATNAAVLFIALKEWGERDMSESSFVLARKLNYQFMREVPEAMVYAFGAPAIPGLGTGAGFSMMLQDRSGNTPADLQVQVEHFLDAARKRPEIGQINTVYRAGVPQLYADIDIDRALKMGVPLEDLNTALGSLLGAAYVNDFNRFGRVYKVFLSGEPEYRDQTEDLSSFFVRSSQGEMVPLSTVVTLTPTTGPDFTNRYNLYRSVELTGVPASGFSSAQALAALEETAKATLPPGWGYDWSNMSYQEKKAAGTGAIVFVLAIVLVFLILAAQYESWSLPFSVLLGTPFAAFGAFLGLWLARKAIPIYENNVFAQIGLVMLIGLAAKNAILIVEFARAKHETGTPVIQAALEAAKLRFRPILMTAFAFILGVVPLLTASGAGAMARRVMGMTVFSGMLIATILGVVLVPVLFVAVERLAGSGAAARPAPAPAGGPELGGAAAGGH
ncbi:MAG: multidrug efflux RND transporter permease subunit [Acidobacteria bacterium]|nr:multidrug efflux RND transporter permease subunit [Acidobacteriota bacterium]